MPLKLNLTIPNKAVHVFIGLVVVIALVVGVYAYTFPGGFIGHGGDNVWINTAGGETTLQTAIDGGLLGADDDWEKVGGGEPVLADNMYHTGNVGIGTTNPSQKLEVNGNLKLSTANPYIYSGGSYIVIPNGLYVSGGTTYIKGSLRPRGGIYNDAASYLTISGGTSGNTYFPGNVGIGTTSPGAKLDVAGAIYADSVTNDNSAGGLTVGGSGGANIELYGSTSPYARNAYYDATNHYFRDYDASPTRMAITSSGNVGIGTTNPSQKLDVAGQIHATGDICTDQGGGTCLSTTAGGGGAFGSWASKSNNAVYQAATDGFVLAYSGMAWTSDISGFTDGSNPPATRRIRSRLNTYHSGTSIASITMPVKRNDYWKVTGAITVYWMPLGN